MAGNSISNPTVVVNNETIYIVPNSLKYDGGEGEINVRAASAGGGSVESIHSVNAESKISKVSFDVFLKDDLDGKIATWKSRAGANSIEFTQATGLTGYVSRSFDKMSLTNLVERNASADGVVTLEWAGDPMTAA